MDLERNLIDNVLECEIKLGFDELPVILYYPKASLMELLFCSEEDLVAEISKFRLQVRDSLGDIIIEKVSGESDRYSVTIPSEGVRWVNANFKPSDFIKLFIETIKSPGKKFDDIKKLFEKFSEDVIVETREDGEKAIYFADTSIDPYMYIIEENAFGLEYHRFIQ